MEFTKVGTYQGAENGLGEWAAREASMEGYVAARRNADAQHNRKVMEAARLYADTLSGKVDPWLMKQAMRPTADVAVQWLSENYPGIYAGGGNMALRETMSRTDYQALFVDVLDRMYYGYYNAYPIVNKQLVKVKPLRDFRLVSRYLLDGMVTPLVKMDPGAPPPQKALFGPAPQEGATPSTAATSTAPLQYAPSLYQSMASINWQAFYNDDLGIFQDVSNRMAIQANRAISKFITSFYVDANGPNALLYTSSYKNQIITANGAASNNPALSAQGIMDALKILAGMTDSTGDPILMTGRLKLWFGPSLLATANNVMNALSIFLQNEGGTTNVQGFPVQFVQTTNWIVQNMDLVMDPYIPLTATSASTAIKNGTWGITIDPMSQNRPNTEVGFLQGFETPQIFQKVPNTMRLGGGVDPMMGDFYNNNQDMKIMTVMGGVQIDGRSTVGSNGSGS